jgi:hypothetical protein
MKSLMNTKDLRDVEKSLSSSINILFTDNPIKSIKIINIDFLLKNY